MNRVAWHVSPVPDIRQFKAGTHFGTRAAALERATATKYAGQQLYLYEVALDIRRPLQIWDEGVRHSAVDLAEAVRSQQPRAIRGWHLEEIRRLVDAEGEDAAMAGLATVLLSAYGHCDGLVYENQVEDEGSMSYVILRPEQALITAVDALPVAGQFMPERHLPTP